MMQDASAFPVPNASDQQGWLAATRAGDIYVVQEMAAKFGPAILEHRDQVHVLAWPMHVCCSANAHGNSLAT